MFLKKIYQSCPYCQKPLHAKVSSPSLHGYKLCKCVLPSGQLEIPNWWVFPGLNFKMLKENNEEN